MILVQVALDLQVIFESKHKALVLPPALKCLQSTMTEFQACHLQYTMHLVAANI